MKTSQSSSKSTILLGLAVLGAIFFLVIKPKQDEVASAQSALDTSQQALVTAQQDLKTLGPRPDDAELADLVVKVPRTADTPAFLNQINLIGAQYKITIGELSFSPPTEASLGIGSEVKVSLTATGPRAAIDQFLSSIAQLPRLAIVDQANLTPVAADGEAVAAGVNGTVTVNLSIVLFTGVTAAKG